MRATIFFIVLTAVILAGIIYLLRSRRLKEKYAALWILVGVVCIVLAAWPSLLARVAELVGIQVASNLLFTLAIVLLLAICLHLSLEVSGQEDKIRRLAEEAAIAREQLESLQNQVRTEKTSRPSVETVMWSTHKQDSYTISESGDGH